MTPRVEVDAGQITFALEPMEWMYNPIGGIAATLLDSCKVVHPGRRLMTVEARLFVEQGGALLAHGTSACIVLG